MPCTKCENGKYKWGENGECKYDSKAACEKANPQHYKNLKTTKIVELVIADESPELTIDAISLVTSPAIEENFVFFGKEKNNLTFAKIDEEKRMLVSPALIPNKQIFRHDPNTNTDYYVYFSKETVAEAASLYLEHNNHHKATYQHEEDVSGVLTVESWIKEGDQDKSKLYGYDLPNGTWFVKMKINNDEMWNKIKEGELKGLSIEGYFIDKMEKMAKQEPTNEEVRTALKELLSVQKFELALDGQLKDQGQKAQSIFNNGRRDAGQVVLEASGKMENTKKDLEKLAKQIDSTYSEALKKAKDIGVNLDGTTVGKNYKKAYNDVTEYIISSSTAISKLRKFSI